MAQDATIVAGSHVNNPGGRTKKYFSTFPLAFPKLWSYRYGELGLIFTDNNVAKDAFHWRLPHNIQSKMLKAPLMQNMSIHKDAFWVAKQAILPNSWENLERYETIGDSAPIDANTVIYNFEDKIRTICLQWKDRITSGIFDGVFVDGNFEDTGLVNEIFHFITFAEMFYSCSNLMANAGHPMWILWDNTNVAQGNNKQNLNNFGWWFDKMVEEVFKCSYQLLLSTNSKQIKVVKSNPKNDTEIDIRTALCYMRDDFKYTIEALGANDFTDWNADTDLMNFTIQAINDVDDRPFNYERLCAYQLAIAQYYTNDHIDYVYTAELWRQLMSSYITNHNYAVDTYTYNGVKILYDWLSGHYLDQFIQDIIDKDLSDYTISLSSYDNHFSYIYGIFTIKRSLRFKDYFTGSRSQPLAVMDYNVAVNNNEVSVIDITKKTLWQKLGNAMNRAGNRIEKQVKELLGVDMKPDYHVPFWLGHTSDSINTPETENTGAAQFELPAEAQGVAVTSRFNSNAGNYIFTANMDRKGIFLSICYFEIPRLYSKAVSQFFYKADKFDEFNPYTQFTGDQAVDQAEKDIRGMYGQPFAYTNHDMEYKQRFGIVGGAFIHELPGWCFIADRTRYAEPTGHISPDYIRALQTEIDDLFQGGIIGYSIDTWYHFIVKTTVDLSGKRPMAYNPSIGM